MKSLEAKEKVDRKKKEKEKGKKKTIQKKNYVGPLREKEEKCRGRRKTDKERERDKGRDLGKGEGGCDKKRRKWVYQPTVRKKYDPINDIVCYRLLNPRARWLGRLAPDENRFWLC